MAGKPGHGGKKGRSGRKPNIATIVKRTIAQCDDMIEEALPELYQGLIDRAKGIKVEGKAQTYTIPPDREAAEYLIDRLKGRPKIAVDGRLGSFQVLISPDERMQKLLEVEAEAKLLLAPWREVDNQATTKEQADNAQESGT